MYLVADQVELFIVSRSICQQVFVTILGAGRSAERRRSGAFLELLSAFEPSDAVAVEPSVAVAVEPAEPAEPAACGTGSGVDRG